MSEESEIFIAESSVKDFIVYIQQKNRAFIEKDRPMLLKKFRQLFKGKKVSLGEAEPPLEESTGYIISDSDIKKYLEVCSTQIIAEAEMTYLSNNYVDIFLDEEGNIVNKLTDKGKEFVATIRKRKKNK